MFVLLIEDAVMFEGFYLVVSVVEIVYTNFVLD